MGSLALRLYLAWTRLPGWLGIAADREPPETEGRPEGRLLWVHADDPDRLPAIAALAERLSEGEPGVTTLVTLRPGCALPGPASVVANGSGPKLALVRSPQGRMIVRHAPVERMDTVRAFLAHWEPDLLLWVGGGLQPALIAASGMPRLLIEAAMPQRLLSAGKWMPGLARSVAGLFDEALATSPEAALRLARADLAEGQVGIAAPLDAPTPVLPCNERERRDIAGTLSARPVWLAADLPLSEIEAVVAAQVRALRSAHRLLLIVAPRLPDDVAAMAEALAEAGLRTAQRADGAEPEEDVQVYLAEGTAELGLWYRLAPLTYVGGTLADDDGTGAAGGRSPFEAAALGSALLHGPRLAPHEAAWGRLAKAGGARQVASGAALGQAVEALLAPDRLAAMAHGAWDVATEGSEVASRVADMVRERMGGSEAALPDPAG